jgi:hypothetical protein
MFQHYEAISLIVDRLGMKYPDEKMIDTLAYLFDQPRANNVDDSESGIDSQYSSPHQQQERYQARILKLFFDFMDLERYRKARIRDFVGYRDVKQILLANCPHDQATTPTDKLDKWCSMEAVRLIDEQPGVLKFRKPGAKFSLWSAVPGTKNAETTNSQSRH